MSDNSNYIRRAQEASSQADKLLRPGRFSKMFSSRVGRGIEAAELYKIAAGCYKIGGDYISSANEFIKCAECLPEEAAFYYIDAGNVIKNVNVMDAIKYYNQAADICLNTPKIDRAASLKRQIAELYEESKEFKLAADSYLQAAELFYSVNDESSGCSCELKCAELKILYLNETEDILKAIQIFETVGDKYMSKASHAYSARACFFKAALLFLANEDAIGAENALHRYINSDPEFESKPEYGFVNELIGAIRGNDLPHFEELVNKNRRMLDSVASHIILKAKSTITQSEENQWI
ncbi:NAPB_2 [Blepharisma stoltei]|uniref:Alpha-SNAP n=1 Tax=Blepharisma stoltei TaxID=1481888 RepID=A0AAU9K924_9CILI|nr:unnamed protein product [Blepharisma stoltei]